MITSFKSKPLKVLFETGSTARLPVPAAADRIRRQLAALSVATDPAQMNFPGWYFHSLQGRPTRYSIRVTGNWRITFGFDGQDAISVDLEDYH